MMPILCILEDDERRTEEMLRVSAIAMPDWRSERFPTAHETIDFLRLESRNVGLISLDHDLEPQTQHAADPGTGRDVADYLAAQAPFAPVLIHSTNTPAAIGMAALLEEVGWQVERVSPYADLQWIEELWLPTFELLLRGK